MFLIIGLGNPGKEYEATRHNYGFMALNRLAENWLANPVWAQELYQKEKFDSLVSEFELFVKPENHQHVILAKPQTMMNNSGLAVKKLTRGLKEKKEHLIVIHDDIDLPVGTWRTSVGASSAGHKGVQSIIDQLKSKDFTRVRLGIKPAVKKMATDQFVLQKFSAPESKLIEEVLKKIPEEIKNLISRGLPSVRRVR